MREQWRLDPRHQDLFRQDQALDRRYRRGVAAEDHPSAGIVAKLDIEHLRTSVPDRIDLQNAEKTTGRVISAIEMTIVVNRRDQQLQQNDQRKRG